MSEGKRPWHESGPEAGLVPGPPLIPDRPPQVQELRIVEWADRADLAAHAFDGQWRVLRKYEEFRFELCERWVVKEDGWLWMQMCVRPCDGPETAEVKAFIETLEKTK